MEDGVKAFAALCCGTVLNVQHVGCVLGAAISSIAGAVPLVRLVGH